MMRRRATRPAPTARPRSSCPRYDLGQKVATRKAYGDALAAVGARPDVVAMDGEVSNSTYADEFAKAYPERYFEMFIAEQQLVAAAIGFGARGYRPFASTFAAFFTRAYDFIRMAAISQANIAWSARTPASRSAPTARPRWRWRTWPCCARCTAPPSCTPATPPAPPRWSTAMADPDGIVYMRTTRGAYPVLYDAGRDLPGRRLQGAPRSR